MKKITRYVSIAIIISGIVSFGYMVVNRNRAKDIPPWYVERNEKMRQFALSLKEFEGQPGRQLELMREMRRDGFYKGPTGDLEFADMCFRAQEYGEALKNYESAIWPNASWKVVENRSPLTLYRAFLCAEETQNDTIQRKLVELSSGTIVISSPLESRTFSQLKSSGLSDREIIAFAGGVNMAARGIHGHEEETLLPVGRRFPRDAFLQIVTATHCSAVHVSKEVRFECYANAYDHGNQEYKEYLEKHYNQVRMILKERNPSLYTATVGGE